MKIDSVAFFTHYTHTSAIEVYRVLSPLKEAGIEINYGIKDNQVKFDSIDQSDFVLLQRDFAQNLDRYETVVNYARSRNKPIVLDIDDLLIDLPENHPDNIYRTFTHALLPIIRSITEADLVTVSTTKLREVLSPYNPNISVLPNYLDTAYWQFKEPKLKAIDDTPITIGYMGGGSHTPDLGYIEPVISNLLAKFGDRIKFCVWGLKPPASLLQLPQTKWIRVSTYSYADFVDFFQRQEADIFIAPLVDNLFNRCKSEIKFLEYSTLGSAIVASNLEPYNSVIKNGVNGFLASDYVDWETYLTRLIENNELRYKISLNAQLTVKDSWIISQNAKKWTEVYQNVESLSEERESSVNLGQPLFNSITRQMFELDQHQKSVIRDTQKELSDLASINQGKDLVIQDKDLVIQNLNTQLSGHFVVIGQKLQRGYERLFPQGSKGDKLVKQVIRTNKNLKTKILKQDSPSSEVNLIRSSRLFDEDWYLKTYPDVARAEIDPALHYLKFGGFESRNPGPNFDSKSYLALNQDAKKANINPLLHYIRREAIKNEINGDEQEHQGRTDTQKTDPIHPRHEKGKLNMEQTKNISYYTKKSLQILKDAGFVGLLHSGKRKIMRQISYDSPLETDYDPNLYVASVIIPVYNAADHTKSCIEKLYASANQASFEIIVVDNNSTDNTKRLLREEQKNREHFSYYSLDQNYGFSGGVNYGFSRAKGKYFIILNNDTLVTPGWIDRLIEAFESDELIGIVSPITNYVGEGPQVDPGAVDISPDGVDLYAQTIVERGVAYESHRLVFFCVALRRELVDLIGLMDTGYVKGNFEDDDYCLRAILSGFKLAIAQNAFVYHFGSMTFKKNRIIHDDYMDKNRMRFFPKVQRLSTSLRPENKLTNSVKISTVVRTKNRPDLLKKALTSLSNQTFKDFEVVLVNDGGDDIPEIINLYSKYFPIRYIHNENSLGRTPALNIGVAESSGNWIAFLDDDDIVYPWHLDMLFKKASNEEKIRCFYSNYNRSIFRTAKDDYAFLTQSIEPWPYDRNELLVRNRMPIHTWLVHRSAFNEAGWFDESMSMLEDFEFLIRLSQITDFSHVNRISCEYRYYLEGINSMINQRSRTLEALATIYNSHPARETQTQENRALELEALRRQIKVIENIEGKLAEDPQNAELYQKNLLSQILGL